MTDYKYFINLMDGEEDGEEEKEAPAEEGAEEMGGDDDSIAPEDEVATL